MDADKDLRPRKLVHCPRQDDFQSKATETLKSMEATTSDKHDEGVAAKRDNFKMPSFHALFKDKILDKAKAADERAVDAAGKLVKRPSERARAPSADIVEGYIRVYLKKQDKNLFFLGKSRYYVVVNAENPAMEIFTYSNDTCSSYKNPDARNDAKTTSIYILSLYKAALSYDPKDDNTIAENMFTMEVPAWTKRSTIHYRSQTFAFREDKAEKALQWVKCISRAILNAAKRGVDGVVGADIFRPGMGLASYVDDGGMSNESDLEEEETPRSRASSGDDAAVHPTVETGSDDLWGGFNLNKLNPFSPSSKTPPGGKSLGSDGALSPSAIAADSAKAKVKLQFPSILMPSTGDKHKPVAASRGSSPMALLNRAIHPRKTKLLSEPIPETRPSATSPHASLISCEERNELMRQRNFDKVAHDRHEQTATATPPSVRSFWAACRRRVLASVSHKCAGLAACLISGTSGLSVAWPIALAGLFAAELASNDSASYAHLAGMFVLVHTMATFGVVPGIGALLVVLLVWNYADGQTSRRKRIQTEAHQIALAERTNYHNYPSIEFPSWVKFADVERAEWLNRAIERSWPHVKIALRNSMLSSLNPVLESSKPTFISTLALTHIDMGSSPPSFGGIKCIPSDDAQAEGPPAEVSWDAEVRFVAGDDQLVEIKVAHHTGAAARVRLKDMMIMGTMRITLRPLVTVWPGFSGVSVSFISQPRVEFSLTAAKINVTNVPFVSDFLQTFLRDLIVNNMVWPKVLDMPLWDPELYPTEDVDASVDVAPRGSVTASAIDDDAKEKASMSVFGPGVVSLNLCKLVALVDDAFELYCIVSIQDSVTEPMSPPKPSHAAVSMPPMTHKTEVRPLIKGIAAFDEKYEFYWEKPVRPSLHVEIWRHHQSLPDEVLGTAVVDVGALPVKRDHEIKIDVCWSAAKEAQLHVHVCRRLFYCTKRAPTSAQGHRSTITGLGSDVCVGMLLVTLCHSVELASNTTPLESASIFGVLTCENQSYSTAVVKRLKSTVWNEQFSYFVYSVETATLHLELFDHNSATSLGLVTTSILELRKRLNSLTDTIKETLPLQHGGSPDGATS
ncbi:extended synaptotagmin [Achlya hypogyna]|uniref:Extended synaptotagmin n=1 Tax=Achlya hypogyna TaxID=1202772 RepID=A0A1V9Z3J4_ACHHY|nr:extended synaptotagmin [Achlya hypogyna]